MKTTYLSSPISSQYGGGEKFLDDFTTGIDAQHEFIGSSRAVYDLFTSKGYKTTLTSGLFEPVSPRNLLLIPLSIMVGLFQFIRFYKTFKEADWIISPTSHCETFFVIPWIKLILHKPILFMVHAPKVPRIFSIFPFNLILSKCWGGSPVVFVSQSQKELWNDAGCVSNNQIVIYNGVKINNRHLERSERSYASINSASVSESLEILNPPNRIFRPAQDDKLFECSNENCTNDNYTLNLGFLARLHKEKGCDVLLNSLKHIKSNQNIKLTIAGDGPEKDNLTVLLNKLNVPTNITVEFVGFQSNPQAFYQSIDLLVFPSRRESFGLVICEAMERGVSVLCSNIPSSLEVKQIIDLESETKLIFESENSVDLAKKIDYFIEQKKVYLDSEYKNILHKTIANKLGLEKMIGDYDRVLKVSS